MESKKCLKYDMIYLYLTGFGVFGGEDENPTELLINEVNSKYVNEKFTLLQNEIEQSMQKNNDKHNNILYVIINLTSKYKSSNALECIIKYFYEI